MSLGVSPARVRSLRETAEIAGISLSTFRRVIADGNGPTITWISPRRRGVRDDHREEWLQRCAKHDGQETA